MKIRKDTIVERLPVQVDHIEETVVVVGRDQVHMHQITYSEWEERHYQTRDNQGHLLKGVPMYFAFENPPGNIRLYPVPDKDYELKIRYTPPTKEI